MSRKRLLSVGFLVFHHCCIENLGLRGFVLEKYMQVLNLNKRITDRRSKLLSADLLVGFYEIHTCTLFLVLPLSSYKGQWGESFSSLHCKSLSLFIAKSISCETFFSYSFEAGMLLLWTKGQGGLVLAKIKKNISYSPQKVFLARISFPFLLREECCHSGQKGKEAPF